MEARGAGADVGDENVGRGLLYGFIDCTADGCSLGGTTMESSVWEAECGGWVLDSGSGREGCRGVVKAKMRRGEQRTRSCCHSRCRRQSKAVAFVVVDGPSSWTHVVRLLR